MSQKFMDALSSNEKEKTKKEKQFTENGALGFKTSGEALVDLNFKVSSYRKNNSSLLEDFKKAWREDADLALKWLFFARDIREGLGERDLFRKIFKFLSENTSIEPILKYVPEFGRWDDLLSTYSLKTKKAVIDIIKNQYDEDVKNMNAGKPISLMAKWLPSIVTSSKDTVKLAKEIAQSLGWSDKQYRKNRSELNKYLKTIEINLSNKNFKEIDYNKVPSMANLKYKNAFLRNDEERRREWLGALVKGDPKVKMNMTVGYPHNIVHSYIGGEFNPTYNGFRISSKLDETLEEAWKALKDIKLDNTIVVSDSSGSMTAQVGSGSLTAIEVAHALGIYCGDHNQGPFKNKIITFSNKPKYIQWNSEETLLSKLQTVFNYSEVANTDVEAVFRLILNTAIKNNCTPEEIPANILIISDMEFDAATHQYGASNDITLFKSIKKMYKEAGYKLPRIIFWNVCGRTNTVPMQKNKNGVALVSGFSVNILKMVMSGKLDPYEVLKEQLMSDRYKDIHF